MANPTIIVHGGTGNIPQCYWKDYISGVKKAAIAGFEILQRGGSAIDAVEKSVIVLEDDPAFNSGIGSTLTYNGEVEMDALIIDGRTMNAGAVAALQNIRNPIKVARMVMERTPHVMLAGEKAKEFATLCGFQTTVMDVFLTTKKIGVLNEYKKSYPTIDAIFKAQSLGPGCDTVGAVALDASKHLAAATSTGGLAGQLPGRVGDCPIVGSGGMADDEIGAVSTTGVGEAIMKVCLAKSILSHMQSGHSVTSASKEALQHMNRRVPNGRGGAIVLSKASDIATEFNDKAMAWAFVKEGQLHSGVYPGEHFIEDLPTSGL